MSSNLLIWDIGKPIGVNSSSFFFGPKNFFLTSFKNKFNCINKLNIMKGDL